MSTGHSHSSDKDRKQALRKFIKCVWTEPGKVTVVYLLPLSRAGRGSNDSDNGPALLREPAHPFAVWSPRTDLPSTATSDAR